MFMLLPRLARSCLAASLSPLNTASLVTLTPIPSSTPLSMPCLALLPSAIYSFYEHAPRVWGLSPLSDQQVAQLSRRISQAAPRLSGGPEG